VTVLGAQGVHEISKILRKSVLPIAGGAGRNLESY
jgi:hypothetical protein